MKITAVIMECNPFHEGHAYILEKAREETGCDYVLVVLSGNYVQRGEPAIFPKQVRTRALLENGADLVVELPLPWAAGSAEYFARGAVSLLNALGCVSDLCFGSETGDLSSLKETAKVLCREDEAFKSALSKALKEGLSYPAARSRALSEKGLSASAAGPNDLLAAEYIRAILSSESPLLPHAVKRISARGATSLRAKILQGEREDLPETVKKQFPEKAPFLPASLDLFSGPLLHALWLSCHREGALEEYPDITPDLANRMRALLPSFGGASSYLDLLKTKNVTWTRLSRCLLKVLLDLKREDLERWEGAGYAGYARVLGFKRSSAPLLTCLSDASRVPLITSLSKAPDLSPLWADLLSLEVRSDLLYRLVTEKERPVRSEYEQALIIV